MATPNAGPFSSVTHTTHSDALQIPKSVDILAHISSLPNDQQSEAYGKIEAIERRAMDVQKPTKGLTELMEYLNQQRVRMGICTRNFEYAPGSPF